MLKFILGGGIILGWVIVSVGKAVTSNRINGD
jgi:hypothetical protein